MFWCGGSFQFAFAVCKISNGGGNWSRTILGTVGDCRTIAIAPSNSNVIYAGGASSAGQPWLFKTTDAGVSWDTLNGLGADTTLRVLVVHPAHPDIVYAGKADGVYRSTDGGTVWTATGLTNVRSIAIDPDAPETVYVGTTSGVYISTSGGGGWAAMNNGLEYPVVTDLAVSTDHYLIASTYGAGMYRYHITTGIEERTGTGGPAILTAFPNPARGHVTFSIGHRTPLGDKELFIYDLTGNLVRDLTSLVRQPSAIVNWDGTDQTGNTVPAGVYLCRLSAGNSNYVTKLIVLR